MKKGNFALFIPVEGEIERTASKPTLSRMQEYVEGYIQPVHGRHEGRAATLLVNEEGTLKRMLVNLRATAIAGQVIVGPAVVLVGYRV